MTPANKKHYYLPVSRQTLYRQEWLVHGEKNSLIIPSGMSYKVIKVRFWAGSRQIKIQLQKHRQMKLNKLTESCWWGITVYMSCMKGRGQIQQENWTLQDKGDRKKNSKKPGEEWQKERWQQLVKPWMKWLIQCWCEW